MKRLIGKIALIALLSAAPVVLYNYFVDQYFVLRQNVNSMRVLPNERWAKSGHLIKNPAKYDSLLFGSSRVSQVPMQFINQHTGKNYYNMTVMAGVPSDFLQMLEILMRHRVAVKHILIGLDIYSFEGASPDQFHRAIMYPEPLRERLQQYFKYLFLPFDSTMFQELRFDGKDIVYDIFGTGEYTFVKKEKNIEEHPEQHPARFMLPILTVCDDRIDKTIGEIRQIMDICRANGITVDFFINPEPAPSYLCDNIAFLNKIRFRLAEVSNFWDFSRPSSITESIYSYVDMIHYRKSIGRMMAARIFNVPGVAPAGFGYLVTKENMAAYSAETVREHQARKNAIKPNCQPCRHAIWK